MSHILQGHFKENLVSSILCIVFGILMVAWPAQFIDVLCIVIGIVFLIAAAVFVITGILHRKDMVRNFAFDIAWAVCFVIIGIVLLRRPDYAIVIFQYIFAIIILIHGIFCLQAALNTHSYHSSHWVPLLVTSIISIVLSIIIMINPFSTANILMVVIGIVLIYDGVNALIIGTDVSRSAKKFQRDIENAKAVTVEGKVEDR